VAAVRAPPRAQAAAGGPRRPPPGRLDAPRLSPRARDGGGDPPAPLQPRSTLPLAACLWAQEQGRLRHFKHALYEAFFCEGEDIATDAELARAATRAGLDPAEIVRAAYDDARFARIRAVRAEAEAAGVRGVPTLVSQDGESHWGMGGLKRLLAGEPLVPRT
jgi:predicted DsbA family dithiol-disulfide isomerase